MTSTQYKTSVKELQHNIYNNSMKTDAKKKFLLNNIPYDMTN